jgi:N-acyl-L-homoserine lactone synthetase
MGLVSRVAGEPAEPAAAWDRLAGRLVDAVAPIRLGVAASPADRDAVYRLRYQVVVERGWAAPSEYPDGLERDHYDDVAVHLVAWQGDALVATGRVVFPTASRLLPTEEVFELSVEPPGRVADFGRMVVAREARRGGYALYLALLAGEWRVARERECTSACGILTPSMIRLAERVGVKVRILGAARWHWGAERLPVQVDMARSDVAKMLRAASIPATSVQPGR